MEDDSDLDFEALEQIEQRAISERQLVSCESATREKDVFLSGLHNQVGGTLWGDISLSKQGDEESFSKWKRINHKPIWRSRNTYISGQALKENNTECVGKLNANGSWYGEEGAIVAPHKSENGNIGKKHPEYHCYEGSDDGWMDEERETIKYHVDQDLQICSTTTGLKVCRNAARHWAYPSHIPERKYQLHAISKALLSNALVCYPTGLGKTLIAAVVMHNFLRWFPQVRIVFSDSPEC